MLSHFGTRQGTDMSRKKDPTRVYLSTAVAKICANLAVGKPEVAKVVAKELVAYLRKLGLVD